MSAAAATGAYRRPEPRRKTQPPTQPRAARPLMSAAERTAHIEATIERWTRRTLAQIAHPTPYEQQAREAQWRAFWDALRVRALSGAMAPDNAPDNAPSRRQRAWAEPDVCSDAADELAYTDDTDDTDDSERDEED